MLNLGEYKGTSSGRWDMVAPGPEAHVGTGQLDVRPVPGPGICGGPCPWGAKQCQLRGHTW